MLVGLGGVGNAPTTVEQRINPLYHLTTESTQSSSLPATQQQPSSGRFSVLMTMQHDTIVASSSERVEDGAPSSAGAPSSPILQRRLSVQPHVMLRHSVEQEHDAAMLAAAGDTHAPGAAASALVCRRSGHVRAALYTHT